MVGQKPKTLSRGIDYFGSISRILRDLSGPTTLIYELIQNADDAAGATSMRFEANDLALVVRNDGVFTDCGQQDLPPDACPWFKPEEGKRRCDFHSFRNVSSGDKARDRNVTGAFGIGFTAVYQVTDRPELISAGRHWKVDETQTENSRIEPCDGCEVCRDEGGTRFVLPWAFDPQSAFRVRARVPAIATSDIDGLVDVLVDVVPTAMLFLKNIRTVEILHDGRLLRKIVRVDDGPDTLIEDGQRTFAWTVLRGHFDDIAHELQERYPDKLDKLTNIAVAIPQDQDLQGRLCAYLPTEERIELPFHINADFFPVSDRKRLVTEGYQGEWNRGAIKAAAQLVAQNLAELRDVCGHLRLWALLSSAYQLTTRESARRRDLGLESFWTQIEMRIDSSPILKTASGEWTVTAGAFVVRDKEEIGAASVLTELGAIFAHPDIRQYCLNLPRLGGLTLFTLPSLVDRLENTGLDTRCEVTELPLPLRDPEARLELLTELERLLARSSEHRRALQPRLMSLALAPGSDGAMWPWSECFSADAATRSLFDREASVIGFIDDAALPEDAAHLRELVQPFGVAQGVECLEAVGDALIPMLNGGAIDSQAMLEWLAARRGELEGQPELVERLAQLPIFPTQGTHKQLTDLVLPGGFVDELGLSDVVDVDRARNSIPLLRRLGCAELDLSEYVIRFVSQSAELAQSDPKRWRQLLLMLAGRMDEIEGAQRVRTVLYRLPVVMTANGFATPEATYFRNDTLEGIIGEYVAAELPPGHELAVTTFYKWLGVEEEPRPADVILQVDKLVAGPVTEHARMAISRVVEHLGSRWRKQPRPDWGHLDRLKNLAWLPAKADQSRWYRPTDLYATFSEHLFESQARFLALPQPVQQQASAYLEALGVRPGPTSAQVVAHLLHCSSAGSDMNGEVYRFLNDQYNDSEISRLKDQASILLPGRSWVSPRWVFWSDQPFGSYRARLGEEFNRFRPLLNRLGVRDRPDYSDAVDVLLEMSSAFSAMNTPIDEDDDRRVYAACWRLLADGLAVGTVEPNSFAPLRDHKVVADGNWLLSNTSWILFDDVPGLADRFPQVLRKHLVRRPEGLWPAMRAAGVRDLSHAVVAELLELGEHGPHKHLGGILEARRRQLGRVLDAVDPRWDTTLAERLTKLSVTLATDLVAQFTLTDFNNIKSPPARLDALYDEATITLFTRAGVAMDSLDLAREVARALEPDVPPGTLAASTALVLGATSEDEADRRLDAAGIPRLEIPVSGEAETRVVNRFGGEDSPSGAGTSAYPGGVSTDGTSSADGGGDSDADDRSAVKGRLRSYVTTSKSKANGNPDRQLEISELDRAGVDRVLQVEREAGRNPKEMPHHNPGYDVESSGADGQVLRYIEVKSLPENWTEYGVSVTPRQMDEARSRRELYWLYVVEHARSHDFVVHQIQNPWSKVDQFLFDDPWKLVAIAATSTASETESVP